MRKVWIILFCLLYCHNIVRAQVVSTIAGSVGLSGAVDGNNASARFNNPNGICIDRNGNIFIADRYNHLIRKMTAGGQVSTYAGTGAIGSTDGPGLSATFNEPWGIACDTLGNLYIADTKNYKIRKIDASGTVSTIAGTGVFGTTNGSANVSRFGFSTGIATTKDGATQYIVDYNTHIIRVLSGGMVNTFAGTVYVAGAADGNGTAATFNHPYGIVLDKNGNLFISDEWNNCLRKITPAAQVSTFSGTGISGSTDGPTNVARFNYPWGMCIDSLNNLYVLDGYNYTVRKINTTTNTVSTWVGTVGVPGSTDGIGTAARFDNAAGIAYNRVDRCFYITDGNNHTIRKVTNISSITLAMSINGSATVCNGDSIALNVSPATLSNYTVYDGAAIVGTGSNGTIKIAALPSGVHTLTCTAIDNNGATASSNQITVTVLAPVSPTVIGNNSFCQGDSVFLTTQTGATYLWSNGKTSAGIWVSAAGNYYVTLSNSSGCKGTSPNFNVTSLNKPTASIQSASTQICPGDSILLTASAGSSWNWSNNATSQSIYAKAGNYSVTVTSANGCSATSTALSISTFSITPPGINPSGTVTIVQGDSVQFIASGGSNYLWSNGASGSTIYISQAGTYTVSAQVNNGCKASSTAVQVVVINSSTMISATGPQQFCEGNFVILQSIFASGNQWYSNGLPIPGANAQQLTVQDSGYYYVVVTTNGKSLQSDSLLVRVLPAPQLVNVVDTTICSGSSVLLNIKAKNGENYAWYSEAVGGTVIQNTANFQTPALSQNTTYYIETVGANGCPSAGRSALTVFTLASPVSTFNYSTQAQSGLFPTSFVNTSSGSDQALWIFGDTSIAGNTSAENNPIYTFPATGDYVITLITTNANGCSDTLVKTIRVGGNNALFIPTTFTPNGDNKNDILRVRGDHFTVNEVSIYDQWGSLIYHGDASNPTWDGTSNGHLVQNGTYVYRFVITNDNNEEKILTGSITVIK